MFPSQLIEILSHSKPRRVFLYQKPILIYLTSSDLNRAHVCRADAYALVHDYKAAVRDVTRAIRLLPAERPLYLRRGKYLLQDRQFKLAAFCVQHIATLDKVKLFILALNLYRGN